MAKQDMKALGRICGLIGGNARAKSLTPKRRKEIAQKADTKRWQKTKQARNA